MRLNLFYIVSHPPYGGFVSYTNHLHRSLVQRGHDCRLYMVKKKFEESFRDLSGTPYQNVDIDFAIDSCKRYPTLIVCMYWKTAPEVIDAMLKHGAAIVIHDPTELVPELIESVKRHNAPVIAIRRKNLKNYQELGMRATYIPHPYVSCVVNGRAYDNSFVVNKTRNACAISRLDFDKHTEVIAEANELLSPEQAVQIYGKENRLFTFHKVKSKFPDWARYYNGPFPREEFAGVKVAKDFRYVVDMSLIKGDGGGTQYCFFEAWDAQSALVIDERWILPGDDMKPGENCIVVNGARELANVLQKPPPKKVIDGGRKMLSAHGPDVVEQSIWPALK